ncbi:DUF799 domain-containing protein [Pasteurella canis]|uniref:Lipoprotein n=1 Tax=Pasteurella canis TaxID=753 RepID=A0A379EW89_9PAST|nr:DUF799 domain-containing protein [Pasteurella canis]MXN89371.1 hypothetical protein [Pasteurella canis]UAY77276.1 DUF799 domain-containing protein [Pasteurella canis]UDW83315.1 DUF799 domain-containing protein [Pasteurella canis]UEA16400.1 DUF799 domain-containing protein [Pasteurella canis]UEC22842.1 DUF799 domain-containing protein [Pasteurella canis]
MKKLIIFLANLILLTGCANKNTVSYDYTALKQSKPKSILIVMPANNSVDVKADTSVLARSTYPLAEYGYYVYPVALVDEVFKQNGLTDGNLIRSAQLKKIHDIFGADSILYVNVNEYGTSYKLIDSVTTVSVEGKLVDLKTGQTLWEGTGAYAQGSSNSNDGLLVALIKAAVSQIIDTTKDKGYQVAAPAMANLIYHGKNGGLLVGPRHPAYGKAEK